MEIYNILAELVIIYSSSTLSSLVFNTFYFNDRIQSSFNKSERKLRYRDLSLKNEVELNKVKELIKELKISSVIFSIIPIYQIIFTVNNIIRDKRLYDMFFEERIEEINKEELLARKHFLEEMKKAKVVPPEIREKLADEDYMPSERDYCAVKILNPKNNRN